MLICFSNTTVHILMYGYYFLAALGPSVRKYLWWKKYLTSIQIVCIQTLSKKNLRTRKTFNQNMQIYMKLMTTLGDNIFLSLTRVAKSRGMGNLQ